MTEQSALIKDLEVWPATGRGDGLDAAVVTRLMKQAAAALRGHAQKAGRIESIWEDDRIRHNVHKDYPELARAIELLLIEALRRTTWILSMH